MAIIADVFSKFTNTTGPLGVGPARIRAVHIHTSGANAVIELTDGLNGEMALKAEFGPQDTHYLELPGAGIRCLDGIYVQTLTNIASITVIYA